MNKKKINTETNNLDAVTFRKVSGTNVLAPK